MTNEELAKFLARRVFRVCDREGDRVKRIEMKGGQWPDHETNLGGLCEDALATCLESGLNEAQQDQR